jgi:eukaryotic-like serine/threonine-protein kinase
VSAVDDFLRKILRSGLLDREHLQNTLRTLPRESREQVPAIVDHLIAQGKLTPFQAYKISQGISAGLVLGPYQLQAPLGRGGMGTVYLALDSHTKQYVALKILPPKVAREEERLLARFRREMELSQKIQHPHIASAVDVGICQGIHYIALEYIPGQTLYRLVASQGPITVARAAHLFAEVASALAYAHRQGVIHRDMKPSNVMVTPHDHAKVLDLGLAFTEGEKVEDIEVVGGQGYIVGSIDYMAPEQTRDPTNIDARADLYALGCCLYFALSGKPPFPSGTVFEKVRMQRHEEPAPLLEKNPRVPEAFAAIVHKLLAKAPADRFGTANELAAALAPWRDAVDEPLDAPSDAASQRAVQNLINGWTIPEPAAAKEEAVDDAVLFRIDAQERPPPSEFVSRSIFSDIDRIQPHVWIIILVAAWIGLLLFCGVGTCVFFLIR